MELKDIFNIKNVSNFLEGNAKYIYNRLIGLPKYKKEQIAYRLLKCKDDCVPKGKCIYCSCPPERKAFVNESCNKGERFPDLMGEEEWKAFKKKNGIH